VVTGIKAQRQFDARFGEIVPFLAILVLGRRRLAARRRDRPPSVLPIDQQYGWGGKVVCGPRSCPRRA